MTREKVHSPWIGPPLAGGSGSSSSAANANAGESSSSMPRWRRAMVAAPSGRGGRRGVSPPGGGASHRRAHAAPLAQIEERLSLTTNEQLSLLSFQRDQHRIGRQVLEAR